MQAERRHARSYFLYSGGHKMCTSVWESENWDPSQRIELFRSKVLFLISSGCSAFNETEWK